MAIAFDNAASVASSATFTATGSNITLVAIVVSTSSTPPGATWNGTAMSFVLTQQRGVSSVWIHVYVLANAAAGSFTIDLNGTNGNVASYTGTGSTQPDNSNSTSNTTGTSLANSITPVADNSWVIAAYTLGGGNQNAGTTFTVRTGAGAARGIGDSNGAITPPASTSETIHQSASGPAALALLTLSPPGGTAWTKTLTDTVTVSDTLLKTATRTLSEAVTVTATLLKVATRTLTEVITNSDTLIRTVSRALLEAFTTSDVFSGLRTKPLDATEAITVSDTFIRSIARLLTEAITNTDTLIKTASRSFAEAIVTSDTLLKTPNKILAEVISLADTIQRTASRSLSEAVTITGTFLKTASRTFTEAITLADVLLRTPGKVVTEFLSVTDQLSRTLSRSLSEAATATATLLKTSSRSLVEVFTLTDVFAHTSAYTRTFTEGISLTVAFRLLRNGTDIFWTNVRKSAASVWDNAVKAATTWRDQTKS